MIRINIRRDFGIIKFFDADNSIIASFSKGGDGEVLSALLVSALGRAGGYELFDQDIQQFVVGNLAQILGLEDGRSQPVAA